ncbi:MAG: ORF6N domain-containing protein [Endomicrobia bacterium]|nr:ORF6N domain-containing protein [Endomicrobiia bacterium]
MSKNEIVLAGSLYTDVKSKILTIRGMQVMIDKDLSELYGVPTKRLNEAVRRNKDRFPDNFMFQLTSEEFANLRSQFATSRSSWGGQRYQPYVFTEHGVAMLASVLSSKRAIQINIHIINAFIEMRKFMISNAQVFQRLDTIELKQLKTDEKLEKVFEAMSENQIVAKQGVFFEGQIFDAYAFVSDLIRKAKKSVIIIDNYVDDRVFKLLIKRKKGVKATIYTKSIKNPLALDLQKHNSQYAPIELKTVKTFHDRFIILDDSEIYHFGASLKDLALKCFAFSKLNINISELLKNLK